MLHMMEIYIIYLYADERYFSFYFDWWTVRICQNQPLKCTVECCVIAFLQPWKIIILECFLAEEGVSFLFSKTIHCQTLCNREAPTIYMRPCSVRWNSVQDTHTLTRFISLESRAKSETGESSHPQERERGGRMMSSMTKAAERGSSKSADLIGEHWR